jgi:hypothetical protein
MTPLSLPPPKGPGAVTQKDYRRALRGANTLRASRHYRCAKGLYNDYRLGMVVARHEHVTLFLTV